MTLSMVEKSWVWRMAEDADVDVDADALGTKAWEVDAEAARRNRAVRALLPTIMVLVDFWGLYCLALLGKTVRKQA